MKTPAFQFYPGDWRKDPELRSISLTARGLWIELLCLMHESSRKGYLVTKTGNSYTNEQLSRMVGVDIQTLEICLSEIEANGVSSREEGTGILFNRRMIRDAELSEKRRAAGELGGNPVLLKQNHNGVLKQKPTPSLPLQSSSSEEVTPPTPSGEGKRERGRKLPEQEKQFTEEFGHIWEVCWQKIGRGKALSAYIKAREEGVSYEKIISAVQKQGPGLLAEADKRQSTPVHLSSWLNGGRYEDDPQFRLANGSRASPTAAEEDWSCLDEEPTGVRKQHG